MATTLQSPGTSVTITDETTYSPASAGTVPFIVAATRRNKLLSSGDIASGTTSAAAGQLQLVTGKDDFRSKFGEPIFRNVNGTPIHGDETNEYGLQAAWNSLDVVDRLYVLPVDIDLDELTGSSEEPSRPPEDGTHWLDTELSTIGLFRWNGTTSAWESQSIYVLNDDPGTGDVHEIANGVADPRDTFGLNGDYAVVTSISPIVLWEKVGGTWLMLGAEAHPNDFQFAPHTRIPTSRGNGDPLESGDCYVKTTTPNGGTRFDVSVYSASSGNFATKAVPLMMQNDDASRYYDAEGGVSEGSTYIQIDHEGKLNPDYNYNQARPQYSDGVAVFTPKIHNGNTTNNATSSSEIPEIDLSNYSSSKVIINGVTVTFDASTSVDGNVVTARDMINHLQSVSALAAQNLRFQLSSPNKITIINTEGLDITVQNVGEANTDWTPNTMTDVAAVLGFRYNVTSGVKLFRKSNWETLSFVASANAPTREVDIETLWYSDSLRVELLEAYFDNSDNQMKWRTYAWSQDDGSSGLSNSLYIRGSEPTEATEGDVWIDSTDVDNYPNMKKKLGSGDWLQIDNSDQTTSNGVLFSNYSYSAPYTENGTERTSAQVNEFAPEAEFYPEGMFMFNMDYSTYNVKEYRGNGEWISVSGTRSDGSPYMGRQAQRRMVVRAMSEAIQNSKEARALNRFFNLLSAPNYLEVLPELNSLNSSRNETGFIVSGVPMRLQPDSQTIEDWANNENGAAMDGEDGLVTFNNMSAVYAFGGLQSDTSGNQIAVSSDMIALNTILRSDDQSYVWFAPAGYTRGQVYNVTALGYVEDNEFRTIEWEKGLQDVLYINNINPIVSFPNEGNFIWGQKTLQSEATAMDRVNVARLTAYLRYELDRQTRPFIFEQNDTQTRQEIKSLIDQFLNDIVDKRGIYDFVTVCDESNNTETRINRNELWVDIAISPVRAVEFIYIPIRLVNTGDL